MIGWTCPNGLGRLGGALIGASEGSVFGASEGFIRGGLTSGWDTAVADARFGGLMGFGIGGGLGALLHKVCFVAGTQVVVGIEEDAEEQTLAGDRIAQSGGSDAGVATATRVRYVTLAIEELVARGGGEFGDGGGQQVLARNQHDPAGRLAPCRISRTYRRTAYHLQVLSLRDAQGRPQTIRVTDEHPFYVAGQGWRKARDLSGGDLLLGAAGEALTVLANVGQDHPDGVTVYNLEVQDAHTYFVRGEGSDAEPVWVHNAEYAGTGPRTDNRYGHNRSIRQTAREVTAAGEEVIAGGRAFDGVYRREAVFETLGGFKSSRRPDLLVRRPDGSYYGINVGRVESNGLPVLRERLAIQDLNESAGLEMRFVSYGGARR